jgi:hypothetical protein
VDAVLEAFAGERLLTLAADTVEISHEVLLRAWPLLRDQWLAGTQADRIVRTRLRAAAGEWDRSGRDPSYLYAGTLLRDAAATVARAGRARRRNPARSSASSSPPATAPAAGPPPRGAGSSPCCSAWRSAWPASPTTPARARPARVMP